MMLVVMNITANIFTRTSLLPLHLETSLNELVNGC